MVILKTKYRGVEFSIEADNGVKSIMADTVAAIDYLHTRETVGEYSGKGETDIKVEPVTEDKPKKSGARTGKGKADREKELADKKAAEAAAEQEDDTDPGDGVDEEAEEAEEAGQVDTKAEETGAELTLDDVREAVMAYTEVKGAVAGKKLVSDIGGATKLSEVKPAKYAALVKAAKAGA